jgi:hypothetical protein
MKNRKLESWKIGNPPYKNSSGKKLIALPCGVRCKRSISSFVINDYIIVDLQEYAQ